ncbi:MAG TPA: TetR family transcriptional regulator [Cellulomonas sp.]
MKRLPIAERREQLIEAAIAVASRDGIDAATVRAVAAEAGVSLGVVHYCFQDKDELLDAMAHQITRQNLTQSLIEMPVSGDPASIVTNALDLLWSGISATRGSQLLSYELTTYSMRHPEVRQVSVNQYLVSLEAARQFLGAMARSASIEWTLPLDVMARLVVMMTDGVVLAWLADGDGQAARVTLGVFADFLASHVRPVGGVVPTQMAAFGDTTA